MTTFYIVAAVVGLGLALLAAIGVGHDHGGEAHFELGHQSLEHGGGEGAGLWIPFLSLRFWTYFFGAFGLSGYLLSVLSDLREPTVSWLAVGTGLVCGILIALAIRLARRAESNTSAGINDMLGSEANVLVAIRPGGVGRIRTTLKGDVIDLMAESEEPLPLEVGTPVIVVGYENDRARVISRTALYEVERLEAR